MIPALSLLLALLAGAWTYWRYFWFFRNPARTPPAEEGFLSPADGTVVYVKAVQPHEQVVVIKQGIAATVTDILREDEPAPKLVIGIFMSPFDVHYNRAPLAGTVDLIRHHPAHGRNLHMTPMHWRTLLNRAPRYRNSLHILQNERTVTRIRSRYRGWDLACYVVQIAGGSIDGIDSLIAVGEPVERGAVFGAIRIGSQVDLIVPWHPGLELKVQPGARVRAGETILIR